MESQTVNGHQISRRKAEPNLRNKAKQIFKYNIYFNCLKFNDTTQEDENGSCLSTSKLEQHLKGHSVSCLTSHSVSCL